ncbi:MAG: magnesium transporter [Anaerolineales bacterium]|nr:magnesium transporter [Anaerolineales bacterium]
MDQVELELIQERINDLIQQRKWKSLREVVVDIPAPDLADLLVQVKEPDRVLLFTSLPRDLASDVFSYLETSEKDDMLTELTDEETRRLLADLPPDERTSLLENLPGVATQRVLNLLSPKDLEQTRVLLGYPEESVGRLMRPDYVAVRPDWTIARALEHIRARGKDIETISIIYVADASWHLLDALELQRFILADPNDKVESIMDQSYIGLNALEDQEEAVRTMDRYDLYAAPVMDDDNILLGIVTVDDILDVAREEATEDFHKFAAVAPLKESYRETGQLNLYSKRIGWLIVLVGVNLISSSIIHYYEDTLQSLFTLAFFIPLLIGTGGNTGAQSATLMVRALATDDLTISDWFRTLLKEIGVGGLLGFTMAAATFPVGYWRGELPVAIIVSATMAAIVVIANLVGMVLPFLMTRLGLDPAVASSPLITTVMDAVGLLIYFSIATYVLITFF